MVWYVFLGLLAIWIMVGIIGHGLINYNIRKSIGLRAEKTDFGDCIGLFFGVAIGPIALLLALGMFSPFNNIVWKLRIL